jgi:hypothetical protein
MDRIAPRAACNDDRQRLASHAETASETNNATVTTVKLLLIDGDFRLFRPTTTGANQPGCV